MHHLTVLASLVLSFSATAQTTTTLATETDFGVFGKIGTTGGLKAVAKNTAISSAVPLNLALIGRGVSATTTVTLSGTSPSVTVTSAAFVDSRVTNGSAGTCAVVASRSVTQAPHSLLMTITNPGFTSLDVTMLSTVSGRNRATVAVDVGANGSVEFRQVADGNAYRKTLNFTGTSVKLRITMSGVVGPGASYDMLIRVAPSSGNGCLISSYGKPCPATTLTGTDTPVGTSHLIILQVANALPSAPVALVAGVAKAAIHLPTSPCLLLTNPLVIVGLTADATGKLSTSVIFSTSIVGTGYLQAIPFDPVKGIIFASNGLRVDCF